MNPEPGTDQFRYYHRWVAGLRQDNPDAALYRKSDTWRVFHSESNIVIDKHDRYIAVAIGEHLQWGGGSRADHSGRK